MGLKEGGLRGSLRNVSVGVIMIPDSVVEDFEDGNVNNWTTVGGSSISAVQNTPHTGSWSMEYSAPGSYDNLAYRVDGITEDYIVTVEGWVWASGTGGTTVDVPAMRMATASGTAGYRASIQSADQTLELAKHDGSGGESDLNTGSATFPDETYLKLELTRNKATGEMNAYLYDNSETQIASASATDTDHTVTRFGVSAFRDTPHFDDITISFAEAGGSGNESSGTYQTSQESFSSGTLNEDSFNA